MYISVHPASRLSDIDFQTSHVRVTFKNQSALSCSVLSMKSILRTQAYIFVYLRKLIYANI